ncbi:hypothetical protein [Shewanella sp. T24-MNA-CIBAN-0130]|uniref:hypothetical protein n=1 Tax=Shewanella sp. T24-MNA-CIBAN-0130 TaxID=3140470 RepID=UPI00331A2B81
MSKLSFPMFTPVFEHDGRDDGEQICFESYLMDAVQCQQKIELFNGKYGAAAVGMVMPFSNRIEVISHYSSGVHLTTTTIEATFLKFGVDYEEFEDGPGNFSTVIYLKDDGQISSTAVHNVKFISSIKEQEDVK